MMKAGMCAAMGLAAIAVVWTTQEASAQDNPSPEQQKKMYENALEQLKTAQERKNQLAAENEKLKVQIDAMGKEIAAATMRVEELRQLDAAHAEKTFFLRSHYMAWQEFTKLNPDTATRWRLYLESAYLLTPGGVGSLIDRDWPAGIDRPATAPATTQPSTTSITQPSTTQAAIGDTAATLPATTQPTATQPVATQPVIPETRPTTQPATAPLIVPATAPTTQAADTLPAAK